MNKSVLIATTVALSVGATFANAEERKGFFLAGGLGLSTNSISATDGVSTVEQSGLSGVLASFKIGGYINPNFALYYQRESSFFDNEAGGQLMAGISGIGGTYYFDQSGGFYIEAGLGLGDLSRRDSDFDSLGGGAMLGFGVEITDNLEGGLSYFRTSTSDTTWDDGVEYDSSTFGAKLTLKL